MKINFLTTVAIKSALLIICSWLILSCQEKSFNDNEDLAKRNGIITHLDTDSTIYISPDIIIKDKGQIRDTIFSYSVFEKFLESLLNSGRFLFVPLKELESTFSMDKVIISLRHDVDYDIASSVRFARREHKLGIRGTYYILNTSDYYSETTSGNTERRHEAIDYIKKIQNGYNHEIGWHNDLVTMQLIYKIDAESYLKGELAWLRSNGINIYGTSSHGSEYCYKYHYLNIYFWRNSYYSPFFTNYDSVLMDDQFVKIKKYGLSDFDFIYDADRLNCTRIFADSHLIENKRWHMKMIDWNSLKPGTKIIILFHPALWDSF